MTIENPAPRPLVAPAAITPQDLWNAAESEFQRAILWRDECMRRSLDSGGHAVLDAAAAAHDRRAIIFQKIATLIQRAFDDAEILERLRAIDATERATAALAIDGDDDEAEAEGALS